VPVPGEPLFFLYVDLTAEAQPELTYKEAAVRREIDALRSAGHRFEDPLDVRTIVAVNPELTAFADFPMELEFLTRAPGGGLSWVGTYGPLSRITAGAEAAIEIMTEHGIPPLIVTRPMRGGHYAVLRMITTFDKSDPADVARTRAVNHALLDDVTARGFVIYKAPRWAWAHLRSRLDPGMLELMRRIKGTLDPAGLLNPGNLGL
jgi:FAD/FMN-containing dehydrogenase